MVERKHFGGDREAAFDYLGIARNVLDALKASMRLNGLQVLARQVTLPNGVLLHVSSMFGQDSIRIEAPPELAREVQDEVDALAEDAPALPIFGTLTDTVQVASQLKLTVRVRDVIGGGTGLVNGQDPLREIITMPDSLVVTIVRTTYPVTEPTVFPPQLFIGGQTSRGLTPFVWDDINGYTPLDIGNSVQRRNGKVAGFSPSGTVIVGSVDVADPAAPGNYPTHPAKWQSKTNQAQVQTGDNGDGFGSVAYEATDTGGLVYCSGIALPGRNVPTPWCLHWDGTNGGNAYLAQHQLVYQNLTSPNKRMVVNGQKFQLDGGDWVNWGPNSDFIPTTARQAPSDAVASCCTFVPYVAPPPPRPTVTTTVLVFSG